MNILVTGCAGFIGFHTCQKLINKKYKVLGIDNLNNYYDVELKKNRLKILKNNKSFIFFKNDLNLKFLNQKIKKFNIKIIIHLAAQAGVRYSIKNPSTYFDNNILCFFNILEASRINKINHLLFASSSSVYGNNKKMKFKENDCTDHPESFYAASKKSNEVMAYSYSQIHKIPVTGLRFFTVYGPYGRPDMAIYKFTKSILQGDKIELYNMGKNFRDFTYIDDAVDALIKLINKQPKKKNNYNIFNIGSGKSLQTITLLKMIEKILNKKAKVVLTNKQKGDVLYTLSNLTNINKQINYSINSNHFTNLKKFINWYLNYTK